ncbi:CD225/dispanin family protein [Streptomyces lydicus]|uniref:CD225/dispanin family protein n=1 Tax=Streptomyces lydicus TaxID=47763 RepID=UPI00378CD7C5
MAKPPTYWPLSIVVFLLFWLLFGAIAMYYSAQVNARWRYGDVDGANQASRSARIVNLIGIGVGILFWIVVIAAG